MGDMSRYWGYILIRSHQPQLIHPDALSAHVGPLVQVPDLVPATEGHQGVAAVSRDDSSLCQAIR